MVVTIRAVSIPDYHTQRQVLRFPPPMREHATAPARFDVAWQLLQFCFDFPDPATAVPNGVPLPTDASGLVARFIAKAVSLAGSPFLAHPTTMRVKVGHTDDGLQLEEVETNFPHEESERGFMTLLRQFAHEGEPASFKRVEGIAIRHDAAHGETNAALLRGWGSYHKKLLARSPESWAYIKGSPPDAPMREIPHAMDPRVDQLLRTYFYGDIIHFGEGRDQFEALSADAFTDAHTRMSLYSGASGLAKYYMGYATILLRIHGSSAAGVVTAPSTAGDC